MRVRARGAYTMKGTSSKTGNAYDMYNLVIEVPQETVGRPKMTRVGIGLDQKELEMEPECFAEIQAMGLHWPLELDLEVGHRVGFSGLQSVIRKVHPVKSLPPKVA